MTPRSRGSSSRTRLGAAMVSYALIALIIGSESPRLLAADDPWLGRDKALHATVSAGLAAGGYAGSAMVLKGSSTRTRVASGLVISLGAGAAKELWDRGRGTPSWRDFAWDGVGAAAGTTIVWLIDRARHRARPDRQTVRVAAESGEPVRAVVEPGGEAAGTRTPPFFTRQPLAPTALDASPVCLCP